MNGTGMMVWENVFGSEVPWNPRDRSILRAMLPVQRRFHTIFSGESWTPLVPVLQDGVFASLWEGNGLRLWTLVNRNRKNATGPLLSVPAQAGHRYFNLIAGSEIRPTMQGGDAVLSGSIPARGIGCFLAAEDRDLGRGFEKFLCAQSQINAHYDADSTPPKITTTLAAPQPGKIHSQPPPGMVEVPAATLNLGIDMRVRECGFYDSIPPTGDVYNFQVRHFHRTVNFSRFAMDEIPVTNAQFAEFLKAARYRPTHGEKFLKHWQNGVPPVDREDHPVVYVDLDDARAYARWAGKRLPTEEEWQYAAQGPDGRKYPWGNEWETGRCNNGETGATTPVRAFPAGKSPLGCQDMCGNVWHWTESERSDGRTRFCIIRGGAFFNAQGSKWYVDGGPQPANFATKFILAWPGLDRCGTIGFRCAADLAPV